MDPGQSGGIASIMVEGGTDVVAWKMPETERDIWTIFGNRSPMNTFAVIERVHSMPKQGVVSSFKFGQSYGFLRACLIASRIPFDEVSPQKWQKAMSCMSKGDKNVTKAKAQMLFPHLKVVHATADALLLAEYAKRLCAERTSK